MKTPPVSNAQPSLTARFDGDAPEGVFFEMGFYGEPETMWRVVLATPLLHQAAAKPWEVAGELTQLWAQHRPADWQRLQAQAGDQAGMLVAMLLQSMFQPGQE